MPRETREVGKANWLLGTQAEVPVDAVLTEGAMKAYRQASTFLWRLS